MAWVVPINAVCGTEVDVTKALPQAIRIDDKVVDEFAHFDGDGWEQHSGLGKRVVVGYMSHSPSSMAVAVRIQHDNTLNSAHLESRDLLKTQLLQSS